MGTSQMQIWRRNLVTGSSTSFASAGSGAGSQVASGIAAQTERFELFLDGAFEASVDVVGNAPPSVSLTAPSAGAVVLGGQTITLSASASDANGVSMVEFFDGATPIATDTTAPYSVPWSSTALGSHSLTARATDALGAVKTSAPVVVTVAQVTLSTTNKTVTSSVPSGSTASAAIRLATAGKLRFQTSVGGAWVEQSPLAEWLEPESGVTATQFEVKATAAGGVLPSSGTMNAWLNLGSATRDWVLTRAVAGTSQALVTIAIRRVGTTAELASTTVTLNATVANLPPSATLTDPTEGRVFHVAPDGTANIPLTATASDADGSVSKVEFLRQGSTIPVDTDTTGPSPFTGSWNNVPVGTYTLTAKATDNLGAMTTSTARTVIVNALPSATMPTPPAQTASAGGTCTFTLSATATDSDGTITQVEFLKDDALLPGTTGNPNPDTTAPYAFTWSNVAPGTHNLSARGTDNRGGTSTSPEVTATCNAPNTPPSVSLTKPTHNQIFDVQPGGTANIPLEATASDSDGTVSKVEFRSGGVALLNGAPSNPNPDTLSPYAFNWNNVPAGSYTLTAVATDNGNASTTSASVSIIVNALPTAMLSPLPTQTELCSWTLSATANDTDGSISKVEFFNGTTLLLADTTAPYSANVSDLVADTYDFSARATDNRNRTGLSSQITATCEAQVNTPPTITLTAPSAGAIFNAPASITLSATASDSDGTVSSVEFLRDDGATLIGAGAKNGDTFTFDWNNVPAGSYTLTAKATDNLGTTATTPAMAITVSAFGPENVPDQPLESLAAELPAHQPGVGATPGQAAASGGSAAYEIPIQIPPGRRGVQPSLALSYSSRAGNGVAGMGFSLSGLSSVHRCPQTLAQDGQIRAVTFSGEDSLCLDGQRLMVTSGGYGQSNAQYATELDSFARVTQMGGDLTSAGTYFKVEYKSGEEAYFGGTSIASNPARVLPSGAIAPLSWLVERRRDPVGNEIRYAYLALGDGETLIDAIHYTGFNGSDGNRKVAFTYEARPAGDQSSSYLAGSRSRQTRRLATISTWAANVKVREYRLAYALSATTARSLLRSLTECGFDGAASACLAPTTFTWQEGAPTQVLQPLALPPELTAPAFDNSNRRLPNTVSALGDLDGDGSREVLYSRPSATVADARETFILSLTPERQVRTTIPATELELMAGPRELADFDRDGRTDLIHYGLDGNLEILFWDGPATATKPDGAFTRRWSTGIAPSSWQVAQDMDGDARADIAVVVDNPSGPDACRKKLRVYRNVASPAGGAAQATFTPYPDVCLAGVSTPLTTGGVLWFTEDPIDVRDLDGDGLLDITLLAAEVDPDNRHSGRILYGARNSSGGYIQVSRPFASLFLPSNDGADNEEELKEKTYHTWLDVNGDGLDDRLYVRTEGGFGRWTLRLNTGNGLGPRVLLSSALGIEFCDAIDCDVHWQGRYVARFQIDDIDGDGRAELLIPRRFATRVCREVYNLPPPGTEPKIVAESAVFCAEDPATDALDGSGWGFASDANGDGLLDDQNSDGAITAADVVTTGPGTQRLYRSGKGAIDDSSYFMDALRFVETGPNAYSVQSTATQIVSGPSSGSSLGAGSTLLAEDFYGDGLPDTAIRPSCSWTGENQCLVPVVDSAGNPLPASIAPRTLPGGLPLLSKEVLVNENRGPGGQLNPDGKTPQVPDLLAMAVDGLGNQALWTYYPLSSAAGRSADDLPLYTVPGPGPARYIDDRHIYFTSSMPVVSTFIQSNGIGGLRSWSYGYREAMYNQMGRGMQGFHTLIAEDDDAGLRTTTTFHQKFPLTGQVERVVINPIARDGEAGMIRREDQVWRCNRANRADTAACSGPAPTNGVWFPYLDSRETRIFDASQALTGTPALLSRTLEVNADDSSCEGAFATASGFDAFGNLTASTQLTFDEGDGSAGFERFVALHCQRTRSSYTVDSANWWLDRLTQSSTTTHQTFGTAHPLPSGASAPDQTQTSTFTWNANRTPASQSVQPGIAGQTRTTSFAYPATNYGLPSAVTVSAAGDANGARTTSTTYSADGYFPQTVSNALGQSTTTLTRSRDGQPSQSTDIQGHLTRFTYDVFGRSVRAEFLGSDGLTRLQPDQRMALTASAGGYQIASVQDGAPTQVSGFDRVGRAVSSKTRLQDGTWSTVDTQYDALGRQVASSAPYRSGPVFTRISGFDLIGRPLGKTAPADGDDGNATRVTSYSYVGRETRIHVCGNLGGTCLDMSRSQDSLGRFVRTVDAKGGITRTWADGNGNVVALQDVAGSTIRASYNALGQRTSVSDPNQGSSSFAYNALGEVLSSTDGRGIVTSNSYDPLGRLIGRSASVDVDGNGSADSVQDSWSYDPVGAAGALDVSRRSIAGVLEREERHSYDQHGRRIQTDTTQAVLLGEPRTYRQRFAYDANYGRLKARSLAHTPSQAAEVIWTRYSRYGHPTRESDGPTGADYRQIAAVDASGAPTTELLGGHWLSNTARREATGSVSGVSHAFDGALQRSIDYRYDVYGNAIEQALDGGSVIEQLQYDSLHRLTQTSRSGAASGTVNYGYDAAGNFQFKSDFSTAISGAYSYAGGACGGGPNAVKSVQLKAGGTRTYCYDGAGNLISDNSGMRLGYDASQRPTVMQRGTADSQFRYGPDGDKARQWGSAGQRIYIAGIEDSPDSNETERYLGDYALIKRDANGRNVQYLLRDRLGSVIGVADDQGSVEWRGFDAFGAPRSGTWADKNPNTLGPNTATAHGFTQHEHLDGLGLIHMNGRVYDYALGRFLGVDPFIQFPGNSQSLNPYSYILNNPLAGTDPTGYLAQCGNDIGDGEVCEITTSVTTTDPKTGKETTKTATFTVAANGSQIFIAAGSGRGAQQAIEQAISGIGDAKNIPAGPSIRATPLVVRETETASCFKDGVGCQDNTARLVDPTAPSALATGVGDFFGSLGQKPGTIATNPLTGGIIEDPFGSRINGLMTIASIPLSFLRAEEAFIQTGLSAEAAFAQTTFRETFSARGRQELSAIAGQQIRTVGDLAAAIKNGLDPGKISVNFIVREGNTLILNTRTVQALERAGVPRSSFNVIDRTGDGLFEGLLSGQLQRNGLTAKGASTVTPE